MATKSALKYSGTQIQGHGIVPGYQLARFRPHRHRVLNLYKKAMRLVQKDMVDTRDNIRRTSDHDFRFEAVLLRSQFDANKHVTSLAKATQLLKGKYSKTCSQKFAVTLLFLWTIKYNFILRW